MRWDHKAVYEALVARFERNKGKVNPLTYLYKQQPDSAVLYAPHCKSKAFREYPLHLNPGRKSWQPKVYRAILPFVGRPRLEKKGADQADDRFLCWKVTDWDGFAEALGLKRLKP